VLSTPGGVWTIVSPLVISLVLTKMTGVALTEKTIREKRPEYRRYMDTVPAFFPKIPKHRSS
jgi:steroid 5-alpha reductase family enzyme